MSTIEDASCRKDVAWIRQRLQDAIALEYSTLPLYLGAMFSLKVQNYVAYNRIRAVVMEEMVHMAIAGNMLAAVGGTPKIKDLRVSFPCTGLPGGVERDLVVGPARYSHNQLNNFLRIERPTVLLEDRESNKPDATIATFYDELRRAIVANGDALDAIAADVVRKGPPPNQVGDNIGLPTITLENGSIVKPLCSAIDGVVDQGEGTMHGSLITGPASENEKSHYLRFAELYYGREYEHPDGADPPTPTSLPARFSGLPIRQPEVINTLAVPGDGYAALLAIDPNAAAVKNDLDSFDQQIGAILVQLDSVWNGPAETSWKTLGSAVEMMMKLRVLSCFSIEPHQVPTGAIGQLQKLYPNEYPYLKRYTDLDGPVFYGPRFINTNGAQL